MGNLYTENSIESLDPLQFTRLKPQVYCGDTTYSTQLLIEILSNSVDEFNIGHGSQIDISITGDKVEVQDHGQGFLINSKREDGKTVLEAAYSVINTSGKYREDGTYEGNSLGNFGIGAKLPIFLSHKAEVLTVRDGMFEKVYFVEGVFSKREIGKTKSPSGTQVTWIPSEEFFTNTVVELNKVRELLKVTACLCPGLTINLNDNGKIETYFSKYGLNELVDSEIKDIEIINNRLTANASEGKYKLDLVMTYTSNYSSTIVPYVNTGLTDTGSHITQLKTTLTREMNKFFKAKKWLKETDSNLTGEDISEGLYIIFNYTAPNVKYDAQVKSRVSNIDTKFLTSKFAESLVSWMAANEKDLKAIVDKAVSARKAREAAKKARENVRNKQEKKKKALKFDSKLADANGKDRSKCEIYITEGDSASGVLKIARDSETQAVIPVRGKVLNCQKATSAQILKNAEIVTMMDAFFGHAGWGIEKEKIWYDIKQLRYGKIIIMSDADVDGAHIKNLFYTFIWNICPELINNGYIYAGMPPLYKITEKGGKSYKYLKDDAALENYRNTHTSGYVVGRMKGLGEMSKEETAECLTDPLTRDIRQVHIEDAVAANRLFDQLMGETVTFRKQFLKEYAEWSNYNVE